MLFILSSFHNTILFRATLILCHSKSFSVLPLYLQFIYYQQYLRLIFKISSFQLKTVNLRMICGVQNSAYNFFIYFFNKFSYHSYHLLNVYTVDYLILLYSCVPDFWNINLNDIILNQSQDIFCSFLICVKYLRCNKANTVQWRLT